MDLKELSINTRNWVDSLRVRGIAPPGSISHGVSYVVACFHLALLLRIPMQPGAMYNCDISRLAIDLSPSLC